MGCKPQTLLLLSGNKSLQKNAGFRHPQELVGIIVSEAKKSQSCHDMYYVEEQNRSRMTITSFSYEVIQTIIKSGNGVQLVKQHN